MTLSHPDELWRLATRKWAEIEAESPDLTPAVRLQQGLVRLVLDAALRLGDELPAPVNPETIPGKLQRGLPVLRNEPIVIPPSLADVLPPICTVLADGGAGDSALHIRDAIVRKEIDANSLLGVSLARDHKAVRTSALHMGLSPDLLWLVGELASSPLAYQLSEKASGGISGEPLGNHTRPLFSGWDRGYCPFCGSWPVFIQSTADTCTLRCSYCALGWLRRSPRCIYCGNAGEDFVVAAPDVGQPQRRVELCGTCGGYTKVLDSEAPMPFPLLAIDDLATMDLDRGAMERGYRRPELFDLDAIEPRISPC